MAELEAIVDWYAHTVYGRWEGAGITPFYCDRQRVGAFAVAPGLLARADDDALFQVFITLAMYQSRRDVDIMAHQQAMPKATAAALTKPSRIGALIAESRCRLVESADAFDQGCSVRRDFARDRATCSHRPRTPCHVKNASMAIRRMGDMGMLPTSAWLHLRESGGGFGAQVQRVCATVQAPRDRADALVAYLATFYRVAAKLATMFVSTLSTPALAPGLTPWWPALDGNHLVVVDANVIRVVDLMRPRGKGTYTARAAWLRSTAAKIDLRRFHRDWPETSPRLVQQAVYWFRSRSNRLAHGDACKLGRKCTLRACPFHEGDRGFDAREAGPQPREVT